MLLSAEAGEVELHVHRAVHIHALQVDRLHSSGFGFMDPPLLSAVFLGVAVDFALIACFRGQSVFLLDLCIQGQVLPFVESHS